MLLIHFIIFIRFSNESNIFEYNMFFFFLTVISVSALDSFLTLNLPVTKRVTNV